MEKKGKNTNKKEKSRNKLLDIDFLFNPRIFPIIKTAMKEGLSMNIRKAVLLMIVISVSLSFFSTSQSNKYAFLKGTLVGMVYDETGNIVSNAEVAVKGVNFKGTLKSDGQGRFIIRKIPTGVYQLSLVSSKSEMSVKKELAIHLSKETHVSLVAAQSALNQSGTLGPIYYRDSEGKILHQETILGDRTYSADYTYDERGRVSTIRDSFDQEWKYEYTPSGKIQRVTRPDKKIIVYIYDKYDELIRIDLPWGYKVFYEKKDNRYLKTVVKFQKQILCQYIYTLDSRGNKVKVDEGTGQKRSFEYFYDGNDNLKAILNIKTGEINTNVVEYKGKVKNGTLSGTIESKNGKLQDLNYIYEFDVRGNIVRQKEKSGNMEMIRQYNKRDLLIGEIYYSKSIPVNTVEYAYDSFDRLVTKTVNNRIRYYYFRDQDGHILRKSIKNLLTKEEKSVLVYTPFHSDVDQDGFELTKNDKTEKLLVRDAEGNSRYQVEIWDVMRHKITLLQRQANMDGDYWGGTESLLGLISAKMRNPSALVGKYCADFYDLPMNDTDPSEEEASVSSQTKKAVSETKSNKLAWMSIGCWGVPMAVQPADAPKGSQVLDECDYGWFDYCVDCYENYFGDDLGGGYDCYAGIAGPGQLDVYQEGTFYLDTDCNNPSGISWYGQWAYGSDYGSYYTAWWDEYCANQTMEVGVSFSSSSDYTFTDMNGESHYYINTISKEAYTYVFIYQYIPPVNYSISISGWQSSGGDGSFTTQDMITVYGEAYRNNDNISNQIYWSISDGNSGQGAQISFWPNSSMRPLYYNIIASINENGNYGEASLTINQDKLDELRQEYIDCSPWTPSRYYFDKDAPYNSGLLGPAAESQKHDYWHSMSQLNGFAYNSNSFFYSRYGGAINFTSGYRCPVGNFSVGGAFGSQHIYGRAFDFDQQGGSEWEFYNVWLSVTDAGASGAYLLGTNGVEYWHPTYPSNVSYDRGHAQW